jgi:hypothetical protein
MTFMRIRAVQDAKIEILCAFLLGADNSNVANKEPWAYAQGI